MKIYLKQISPDLNATPNNNNLSSLNRSVNNLSNSNRLTEQGRSDLLMNFEKRKSPLRVVIIKNFIANKMKCRIENVNIFINPSGDVDNSYGLSDEFDVLKILSNKTMSSKHLSIVNTLGTFYSRVNKENVPSLYFKIYNDIPRCKIIIEFYLKNIETVLIEVSVNCSIYILKHIIKRKLEIPEDEQTLIDLNNNKIFKNDDLIINILNSNQDFTVNHAVLNNSMINSTSAKIRDENQSINFNSNNNPETNVIISKTLRIKLIRKGPKKCAIGIDFSFNILKNINKIEFSDEAPSFRAASDGINIICYCFNNGCKIENQMFVKTLGFGKFELIREFGFIYCPICKTNKIDFKNLGFINCEWIYRGILSSKANCIVSGDGITIENKLYILDEVSLNQRLERLEIQIKEKKKSPNSNKSSDLDLKYKPNNEPNSNTDLDSIGLESLKSMKSLIINSKNEDNELFNLNNLSNVLNINSNNYLELENNLLSDSQMRNPTNKDSKKKSIFSNSINNSNMNTENENFKQSLNYNSNNNKSYHFSSSKLIKSVDLNLNSSNNKINNNYNDKKKSHSPENREVMDYSNKSAKKKYSNANLKINDQHFQNQIMTIDVIHEERKEMEINLIDPRYEIHIEKNSNCIDQSCLTFFSKKKDVKCNNKSCIIF